MMMMKEVVFKKVVERLITNKFYSLKGFEELKFELGME